MHRNRYKLSVFFILSVHLSLSARHVDGFYTQRQRYASRMLKITPKECHSNNYPNVTGICMISLECQQRSGTVIGACRDGHLFGACCHDPLASQLQQQQQGQQEVIKSTTEATTTTTEADLSSFAASSSSSQQENNEVIPIDSDAQLDSQTAIPSLIDTFSELSPTFLSELALDEHTTGMYASLPISDGSDIEDQQQALMKQKIQDATSASNMISTEFLTTTDRNPRTSTSTVKFHGVEPTGGGEVFQDEVGGIDGLDLDFKDNMIKYIDEIVTMRNNELTAPSQPSPPEPEHSTPDVTEVPEVPVVPVVVPTAESVEEPVPVPEAVRIRNELEDMPFSTFTIVSSTKPAEHGHEIHTIISTTGSGDKMLPSTTTPVPPASEEIVGVTVARSIASIPSSTENEINEIKSVTESTTQQQVSSTESVQPTKFTFSKLKYSPRPFKPRHTTEKVVWTRPPTSTPIPPWKNAKPVELEEDEEDEEEDEDEEDDIRNNLISSSSTQATSVEDTTMSSSTERGVPSSTEGGISSSTEGGVSSSTSYFADDNVEAHNYNGGVEQTTHTSDYPYSSYLPSSYPSAQPSYYPQSSYSPPQSSYSSPQSSYSPPQSSYSPPESSYSPPQSSYSPPQSSYSPPQSSYSPPQSSYSPPPSSYTPSELLHSSPISSYSPPQPSYYSPNSLYSPPVPSDSSSPSSYSSYYTDSSSYPYSSSSPGYIPKEETPSEPSTTAPSDSYSSTTGFGFDWTSPTILSLLKATTENLGKLYFGSLNASRSDFDDFPSTTENEIETSPNSISTVTTTGKSSSTDWKSTPQMSEDSSSSHITNGSGAVRTTGLFSTNPNPTASSSWDSSIDSFVDQNKQAQGVSSTTVGTIKKNLGGNSTTPSPPGKSSGKSSKHSASREKLKHKSRPQKTSTSTEAPTRSTTSKERLKKVKTKVPAAAASTASKRRTNKNKAKPVKKVTTSSIKTANSTKKRLDYKKDCGVRPLIKRGRIVGGTPSQFGSWPWHALVKETVWWGIFSKIKCGGVLIGPQHVLTAAHCQPQQSGTLSVVLGIANSDDTDSRAVTKTVKRIIPHPQFNARTYENDIAILELESPVDFQPHIVPICLPKDDDELEGKTAFVTGMGLLKHDGERPLILQEVDLPILNNTECQKMFIRSGNKKPIIDSFICAGYEQGRKDSCGGDSGGPLSVKRSNGQWVLAGTVSHGIKCALPDQPGVYMRTSYYKPWIDRVLNIARSRFRGIPRCNAPPLICARQRHYQQQLRQNQARNDNGFVNTLFRIFRLARKMVEEGRKTG